LDRDERLVHVLVSVDTLAEALQLCVQLSNVTLSKAPAPHEDCVHTHVTNNVMVKEEAGHHRSVAAEKAGISTNIAGDPMGLAPEGVDVDSPVPVNHPPSVAPPKASTSPTSPTLSAFSAKATTTTSSASNSESKTTAPAKPSSPKSAPEPAAKTKPVQFAMVLNEPAPAKETPTPAATGSYDVALLAKCKTLRDVIGVLQDAKVSATVDDMVAACESLKGSVPLIGKIPNVRERVTRTLEIMGILDVSDTDSESVN
jgi:hypothetical protein